MSRTVRKPRRCNQGWRKPRYKEMSCPRIASWSSLGWNTIRFKGASLLSTRDTSLSVFMTDDGFSLEPRARGPCIATAPRGLALWRPGSPAAGCPYVLTRPGTPALGLSSRELGDLDPPGSDELFPDPFVGSPQAVFKRDFRLPLQHLAQTAVIAVPAANALRGTQVVALANLLPGGSRYDID